MNLQKIFGELKRRNVYKVAAAYAVVLWLLIQIATQVFPFFEIPNWTVRLVVLLLMLGFPVALILAWVFELTPEGIKRTEDVSPDESIRHRTGRRIVGITVTLAVIAAALLAFRLSRSFNELTSRQGATTTDSQSASSAIPEKSIAVLPFENLTGDKEKAYFADAFQDEILARLSKIADLKVISRTSTQHYKTAPQNLPEIAKQLGVAYILEGSVQKSGDSLRVNVQLIRAADDSHLWGDVLDRKSTDIFAVESEVAKAIADQLRAKLTGKEEEIIAAKPTDNPEAYDAYLRGLAYTLKTGGLTPAKSLGAQKYLREAVHLDAKFALAWALLLYVDALGYITQSLQPTAGLREETREAAERALTLQPDLGEALMAKGYYYYGCLKDYDSAVRYFEQARTFLPNNSRIPESLAYVARRQGQWDQSESHFNEAERLDPRNANLLTQHVLSYIILRRFPEALRKLDQVLNITPDDIDTVALKAVIVQANGDLPQASALLKPLRPPPDAPFILELQVYQAILERRPEEMIVRLKEMLAKPDPALGFYNGELRFWLGWAQEVAGDNAAAKESWEEARNELELFLKAQPENFALIQDLALTNMGLGNKVDALALVERDKAVNPTGKDAMYGPFSTEALASDRSPLRRDGPRHRGLKRTALDSDPGPFGLGSSYHPALLRTRPLMFDPVRNDPRFQKLTAAEVASENRKP